MNKSKEIVLASVFIAMGFVLPMIFHFFSMGGPAFLPMHIPILIAGMVLTPKYAILVGIITPILSSVLTGMPPIYPMLPIMIVELATYGGIAALCIQKYKANYIVALLISMVAGRISAGIVVALLAIGLGLNMQPMTYIIGAIITGFPGLLIQLFIVPGTAKMVEMLDNKVVKTS